MAWSRVQSKSGTSASTASLAITLTSTPVTGNKIIVGVTVAEGAATPTVTVKDGNNNSLTQLSSAINTANAMTYLFAYDVPATPSSAFTVANNGSGPPGNSAVVQEISGLLAGNTSAMLDGTPGTHVGSFTGAASATSPTYSSTAASEFLVSVFGDFGNTATMGTPTGYSLDINSVNASSSADACIAYKNSTSAAESVTWTATSNTGTDQYGTILGAFALAAGGGATGALRPLLTRHSAAQHSVAATGGTF